MKIYIAADHRGYKLKEKLRDWLFDWAEEVEDLGAHKLVKNDDYTLYAEKVAVMVADNTESLGILLCGSGVGVLVVANKFDGIRAALGKSQDQVVAGRADDDMNVLVIASDFTSFEEATDLVASFIETPFTGAPRHKRRLEEIKRIEENN